MPSLAEFDHVLVKVGGPTPFYWDPTEPDLPPGELRWDDGGRKALVLAANHHRAGAAALRLEPAERIRAHHRASLRGDGVRERHRDDQTVWGESAAGEHASADEPRASAGSLRSDRSKSLYETGDLVRFEESGRERGETFQRIDRRSRRQDAWRPMATRRASLSRRSGCSGWSSDELLRDETAPERRPAKISARVLTDDHHRPDARHSAVGIRAARTSARRSGGARSGGVHLRGACAARPARSRWWTGSIW